MTQTFRRTMCALFSLLLAMAAIVVAPGLAHAAEDEVTSMAVSFDVRADGSVGVRYELHWRFAETGRHGIDFNIATREPWEADPMLDVVYEVSDLKVDSPSGAPDQFERTDHEAGSDGELRLRIGDPDTTLDTRDATYVISYELRGALRTFDGVPELHWDVTSGSYPKIREFTVTVTGPEGVDRARCLTGPEECGQSVTDGVAALTGSDVARGNTITAVAAFPAGSIADAEPILEERRLTSPVVVGQDSTLDVDEGGGLHAEHTITYRFPVDRPTSSRLYLFPIRLPHSTTQDRVLTVSNLTVTDAAGAALEHRTSFAEPEDSFDEGAVWVEVTAVDSAATVVLSYDVAGAIGLVEETGETTLRWPITHEYLTHAPEATATWRFPGEVDRATCVAISLSGEDRGSCFDGAVTVAGDTVHVPAGEMGPNPRTHLLEVTLPAAAVGGAQFELAPSKDLANTLGLVAGAGGGLVGLTALIFGLGRVGGLMQRKDERFVGVPPGLTGDGGAVGPTKRDAKVPVRFHPPELDLVKAGVILDGAHNARHTAAALTQLAVDGAIGIETKPLRLVRRSRAKADGTVGHAVYNAIPKKPGKRMSAEQVRKVNRAVNRVQKTVLADRSLFRAVTGGCAVRLVFMAVFMLAVPAAAIWVALFGPWDLTLGLFLGLAGVAFGSFFGCLRGLVRSGARTPLAAGGTALRDQIRGFRTYIATAEAKQLDFEAERDIFRRYLPWAVLFGLTKRWTEVCEELAAAGLIPPLDTSFAGGVSTAQLTSSLGSLQARASSAGLTTPTSSSGGGSGGSSGFSSGGGGSGGGGTSASSW
ncbi:hypothetical protein GCM10028820_02500 [Tessaracoccus terricola]